jgi:hypothetical protein
MRFSYEKVAFFSQFGSIEGGAAFKAPHGPNGGHGN